MGGRWNISKREMKRRLRRKLHEQGLGPRDPARSSVDKPEDLSYPSRTTND